MKEPRLVSIEEVYAARQRLAGGPIRTPLVRLNVPDAPAEIYLKLENLQPVGSFKLRGAGNAMLSASPQELAKGAWTASTGNMAQSVAWYARRLGIPCTVVGPNTTSDLKVQAVERLGARFIKLPWEVYFQAQKTWQMEGMEGLFIHPFADPDVIAGNGTIALEILEDLPDVSAIVVSYGGGGLSCGIGSVLRALRPDVRLIAAEVETGAPLTPSLAAGRMVQVPHTPSFVDAIGSPSVFPQMWPVVQQVVDSACVVSLRQIADAIALLAEKNHIIAEGAGAIPVAAALAGHAGHGKVVCVISGGNLPNDKLRRILAGEIP